MSAWMNRWWTAIATTSAPTACMWLAGAGVKGGQSIGATDELGFKAVEERCHISDLHATVLQLLGLEHTRLTYLYQGLRQRLTGVRGQVIEAVLAG